MPAWKLHAMLTPCSTFLNTCVVAHAVQLLLPINWSKPAASQPHYMGVSILIAELLSWANFLDNFEKNKILQHDSKTLLLTSGTYLDRSGLKFYGKQHLFIWTNLDPKSSFLKVLGNFCFFSELRWPRPSPQKYCRVSCFYTSAIFAKIALKIRKITQDASQNGPKLTILGSKLANIAPSWRHFGPTWAILATRWAPRGLQIQPQMRSNSHLGPSWRQKGRPGLHFRIDFASNSQYEFHCIFGYPSAVSAYRICLTIFNFDIHIHTYT